MDSLRDPIDDSIDSIDTEHNQSISTVNIYLYMYIHASTPIRLVDWPTGWLAGRLAVQLGQSDSSPSQPKGLKKKKTKKQGFHEKITLSLLFTCF